MRARALVVLCVLGAAALAGGWYFGTARQPTEQTGVPGGTLMFPGLTAHLADSARIEITHQNKTIAVVRLGDKAESPWGLEQRGNYPVQPTKLREMLTALTELRLVEPRTTDPAMFGRLGLADATAADSTANLLRVLDSKGHPIAELLVGHRRVHTEGNAPDEVYVRRPNETQTWLAEGSLQVDADPQQWFDRDIMNIDHTRITGVVVHRGGTELDFAAKSGKLVLTAPADAAPLDDYKLDDVDRGLELLTLEDVTPDKDTAAAKVGEPIGTSVFTTTDGLAVHVTVLKGAKDIWARFNVDADGAAGSGTNDKSNADDKADDKSKTDDKSNAGAAAAKSKAEAAKLNARLAGWTFQLGSWKEASLTPDLDALKAAPPSPSPAAVPTGPPTGAPAGAKP